MLVKVRRNLFRARLAFVGLFALALADAPLLPAAIIGTNTPSQPLTAGRIATLPRAQQSAWKKYLKNSMRQLRADQDFFRAEMKKFGIKESTNAPSSRSFSSILLNKPADWYGGEQARRIADIIVSFQTPAGGWSKRLDLTLHVRAPGEHFSPDNGSRFLSASDNDAPHDSNWSYVGTFDNDATTTQLRYLAKVIAALRADQGARYRAAFLRGFDYILAAQYPNGGWPQVWPLQGGYHDDITYNDGAMIHVMELLGNVRDGQNEFAFVPQKMRAIAAASLKRGIECILASQIVVGGRRTVWCQQHDALTLKPTSARNYEMPCQTSGESAEIMMFLMALPNPGPDVAAAVNASAAWFEKTKMFDVAFRNSGDDGRLLVSAPGNGPLWARYYEIGSDRPIFGDRDKSIHDSVAEISNERRKGYSWYGDTAKRALEHYARWSKARS